MRRPTFQLSAWLVVLGWILIIGGIIEAVDYLFYHNWPHPWWRSHSLLHSLISGPAVHLGIGSALWALARR